MSLRRMWLGSAKGMVGAFNALTNGLTSSMPEAATADRNAATATRSRAFRAAVRSRRRRLRTRSASTPALFRPGTTSNISHMSQPVEGYVLASLAEEPGRGGRPRLT